VIPCRLLPLIALVLVIPQIGAAHRFAPSLLRLTQVVPHQYNVVWKTPSQAVSNVPLVLLWPDGCEFEQLSPPQPEGTGIVTSGQLRCGNLGGDGLVGDTLAIAGLQRNQASVLVMVNLLDGRQFQQVLSPARSAFLVPEKTAVAEVISSYTRLGTQHILAGLDHLLFVFGLLLLVGGGRRLLWTITAFTAGHSITLSLVSLGFFGYPVELVEFLIALSIFFLAVELSDASQRGLLWRSPGWLAGGFGLLHGMGFAGALAQTGLPQDNVPLALLSFNVGIEIGQIIFIFAVLGIWFAVRRLLQPWQQRLLPVPIYVLGAASALWCLERGLAVLS
jgi:hydrogenase/urease accessory protein HupE